ncbi:MAG: BolA family transcriptional regulator [Chlamydiia bacterium]|nr:BolA family transcriptional regulator [Chlamydiia bacterium]
MVETTEIKNAILNAFEEAEIMIQNPMNDGLHFEAVVISPSFEGLSLVEQHQMVMGSLKGLFDSSLHALSLKTYTPQDWEKKQ